MTTVKRPSSPSARDDSQTVIHNSVTLFARQVVVWVLNSVLILFLPRYLGDQGLGQLQFAISFVTLFSVGIALGSGKFLVKEVARDRRLAYQYIGSALGMSLCNALLVLAVIAIVAQFLGLSSDARLVLYLAALAMIAVQLSRVFAAFLHGFENMDAPAIGEVANKLVVVIAGVAVLLAGAGVIGYASILFAGAAVQLLVIAAFLARDVPLRVQFRVPLVRTMLTGSIPFLLMGVLLEVYAHTDVVMLRMFTEEAVVGWYAAARQLYVAVQVFPLVLTTALLPTLARVHAANAEVLANIAKKAIAVGALIIVPLSLGLSLLSEEIISFLPYPSEFRNSVPLLTILALSIPPTTFLTILGTIVIAVDRQKLWAAALAVTVGGNVALNVVAIPYFHAAFGNGAIGAALTTLVCEIFMVVLGVWLMPKMVIDGETVRGLLKTLMAGGVLLAVGLGARATGVSLPFVVMASAGAYVAFIFGARVVAASDVAFIWEAARRRAKRERVQAIGETESEAK